MFYLKKKKGVLNSFLIESKSGNFLSHSKTTTFFQESILYQVEHIFICFYPDGDITECNTISGLVMRLAKITVQTLMSPMTIFAALSDLKNKVF